MAISVQSLLAMVLALGPKIDEAWPHLKTIGQELNAILTIMNGGHPITAAAAPSTADGSKLVSELTKSGKIPRSEAEKFAALVEAAQGRISR